jgi:hypothetical protein
MSAAHANPKSATIDEMVSRFAPFKEIMAAVRMQQAAVRQRIYNRGYRREYITHEERAHLLRRRGVKL